MKVIANIPDGVYDRLRESEIKEIPYGQCAAILEAVKNGEVAECDIASGQKIGTLEPGRTVKVGGIEVDILDIDVKDIAGDRGVLVLAHDILFNKAFDEDNGNNWEKSSLREYLNCEWLDDLKKSVPGENILSFKRDLTTEDGLDDYGTCADIISMISCEEYRKYRKYISSKSDWWWTLTACSIPRFDNPCYVQIVGTDGPFDYYGAYHGHIGVAPVFLLSPDTIVEMNKNENK